MNKGLFITVSGIDGSGKSTCAEWIRLYLCKLGFRDVRVVDCMKPGYFTSQLKKIADGMGAGIRGAFSPELLNLTWTSDLIYNRINIIDPALRRGGSVITHRSELCCRVYSHLFSNDCCVTERLLVPMRKGGSLDLYIDTPPLKAFERIKARGQCTESDSKEKKEYLIKAYELYGRYLRTKEYENVRIISNVNEAEEMYMNVQAEIDGYISKQYGNIGSELQRI